MYAIKRVVEKGCLDCDLLLTQVCEATQAHEIADERRTGYEELWREEVGYIDDVDFVGAKNAEVVSFECY